MKKTLLAGLPASPAALSEAQVDTLCRFGQALIEKNEVMNLTAITEPSAVAELHFLDCIALLGAADFRGKRVIDVGCGAGFPGVPLKIAEPSIRLTLLDSLGKRMNWLAEVASIYEYPVADAVHKAVVIEKVCPTPPQYPRAFAKIKKAPL